jgi:pheromone shutdown protein TraB
MPEDVSSSLPSGVATAVLEGKTVYVVGTAHVSAQSVQDVRAAIAAVQPDVVAIELCEPRYQGMVKKAAWRQTNLFQVIKQGKATFLLAQLALQSFYRRLGKQLETEPGAEMLAAAACAEGNGRAAGADRPAHRRDAQARVAASGVLAAGQAVRRAVRGDVRFEKIEGADVEALKKQDQLEALMGNGPVVSPDQAPPDR